jgi:hypothetical protein
MAATNHPKEQPPQDDGRYDRPTLAEHPASPIHRSRWIPIAIGIVILVAIGAIAYVLLYSGDGGGRIRRWRRRWWPVQPHPRPVV